jgi:hypothetical protein
VAGGGTGGGTTGGGTGGGTTGGGTGGGTTGGGTGGGGADCTPVIQRVWGSGGCQLTLVAPTNCATASFSPFLELAWSTNGTLCEGPHRFFLIGHPPSEANSVQYTLGTTNGSEFSFGQNGSTYAMTPNLGGYVRLVRADLSDVTSSNGQYHWAVGGFFNLAEGGSISESRTFFSSP